MTEAYTYFFSSSCCTTTSHEATLYERFFNEKIAHLIELSLEVGILVSILSLTVLRDGSLAKTLKVMVCKFVMDYTYYTAFVANAMTNKNVMDLQNTNC